LLLFYDSRSAASFILQVLADRWRLEKVDSIFLSLLTINNQFTEVEERSVFRLVICGRTLDLIAIEDIQMFKGSKFASSIKSQHGASILSENRCIDVLIDANYGGLFLFFEKQLNDNRSLV
jgi:hypothetical protein